MDKEMVKQLIAEAIDNLPEGSFIADVYTEHGYMDKKAFIKIRIETIEETEEALTTFHDAAHAAFHTKMGFIS